MAWLAVALALLCAMTRAGQGVDIPDTPVNEGMVGSVLSVQNLKQGWNQVFIPVLLDAESQAKVLSMRLFFYDAAKKAYVQVTAVEQLSPNQRYWVYSEREAEFLLTGSCLGVSSADVRIDDVTRHWIVNQEDTGIVAEGKQGDKGDMGPQGLQGEKGDAGPQGPQGLQGEKGETGAQGPQGLQGEKGETGAKGPQGIRGEKGEKGETGAQGPQGLQGEKGEKGEIGETGAQGPRGIQGEKGEKGEQGDISALTNPTKGHVYAWCDGDWMDITELLKTTKNDTYMYIDLSAGPEAASYPVHYTDKAPDVTRDECRTTQLWLRKIPAGMFKMGSPEDERARNSNETLHWVTLTQDYYIGVFECTQKQWELVMGSNPSSNKGRYFPVECVSYDMIRGTGAEAGAGWPKYGHAVNGTSFMGKLQAKTGLVFDLPTEAQWEYACRLKADGTCWTTALNSGKDLTRTTSCPNMAEVGRYKNNQNDGKGGWSEYTRVGSYHPSELGLYDMHGNVWEWCLDWYGSYGGGVATNPAGPAAGTDRLRRGGRWDDDAGGCRSAYRGYAGPSNSTGGFRVTSLPEPEPADEDTYVVVDLSGGPDATSYPVRYSAMSPNVADDTCRTTELWLRKIPAGTFMMGSPEDELGRYDNEALHQVTLTQDYYIGVFECTQKQWELVMGSNPSSYKGDCRPVEMVSYDMIRGTGAEAGVGWPTYGHAVDGMSFMGKLQTKTGLLFDLPTEAQWEYACRLNADRSCWTTALNSGKDLTSTSSCPNMAEVGRYGGNKNDGKGGYSEHTKVGSYHRNELGLYDMHGNVYEWCLDWYTSSLGSGAVVDPAGPATGSNRLLRGGRWYDDARSCRSAYRNYGDPLRNYYAYYGFRVACLPVVP